MTRGSPPSSTLTTEFVVPRSMPTARAMSNSSTSVSQAKLASSNNVTLPSPHS
jgi:hypothetical protein